MEDKHEKIFSSMRAGLSELERKKTSPNPDHRASAYLRAGADRHVFDVQSQPAEKLTGKEKVGDILHLALKLEKDSIVFCLYLMASLSRELETLRHQPICVWKNHDERRRGNEKVYLQHMRLCL